jgi:hypothetical protein
MGTYKVEVEFIAQVEQLKGQLAQAMASIKGTDASATTATTTLGRMGAEGAAAGQKIKKGADEAGQGLKGLAGTTKDASSDMGSALTGLIGKIGLVAAAWKAVKSVFGFGEMGIEFNSAMETAQLGIASLIAAQSKLTDESGRELKGREALNAALVLSSDQMQKLKIAGLETVATTQQLVVAYQQALGVGLSVGMSLDEIREITIKITQAASALGVPLNQLAEEVRDLLQGNINPRNTRIATALHITNEEVRAWQAAGGHTLADELNKRMEAFGIAGEKAALTWSGVTSNVIEASQTMAGAMTQPLFDRIKTGLQNALKDAFDLKNARISDVFSGLVEGGQIFSEALGKLVQDALAGLINMLQDLSAWLKANEEEVRSFTSDVGTLASFVGGALAEGIRVVTYLLGLLVTTLGSLSGFLPALVAGLIAGAAVNAIYAISLEGIGAAALSASLAVKTFLASLGPVGWAAIAVGVLAGAFTYMSGEADRAHASTMELLDIEAKQTRGTADLAKQYLDLAHALDKGGLSVDQTRSKKEQLRLVIEKLKSAMPEYRDQLDKITGSYKEQREQLEAIIRLKNAQPEAQYRAKLDEAAAAVKEAEALGKLILIDANNEDPNAPYAAPLGARDKFTSLLEHAKAAKAEADALKKTIIELPQSVDINPRDTPKPEASDRSGIISAREIEARLAAIQASSEEKITLEQQKQAALARAKSEYLQEAAHIEKEAAEGKFDGNQAGVDALWAANIERRKNREAAIEREFSDKRIQMEGDLQARLTAGEEGGLQQRLEAVRKHYDKLRQDAKILRTAQMTDADMAAQYEDIKRAEDAAKERARQDQIRADLGKLKQELAELAQIKGRALSFEEQAEVLDRFAAKSKEAAEAVAKLREELQVNGSASKGWFAGIKDWVTQAGNAFQTFKTLATGVMNGVEQAFTRGISGLLSRQMSFGQAMKAIWQGIAQTVIQAVAQMIARWLAMALAKKILGIQENAADGSRTAASLVTATAETWAAYAPIPGLGPVLAMAQIAAMYASMATSTGLATAQGAKVTAMRVGGLVEQPQFTWLAEDGVPEVVAPRNDFMDWAHSLVNMGANLQSNVSRNDRVVMDYSLQSAGYAREAAAASQEGSPAGYPPIQASISFPGAVILDSSDRGMETLGAMAFKGLQVHARRTGQVIEPAQPFGARI